MCPLVRLGVSHVPDIILNTLYVFTNLTFITIIRQALLLTHMKDLRNGGLQDIAYGHPASKCQKKESNSPCGILGPVFITTTFGHRLNSQ